MASRRTARRFDLLSVLGPVYAVDQAPERWLTGIIDALRPTFDFGDGGCGYFIDAQRPEAPTYWGFVGSETTHAVWNTWLSSTPPEPQVQAHRGMAFGTVRGMAGPAQLASLFVLLHPYADILGINGVDEDGRGVALAFPSRTLIRPPTDALGRELAALSTHLTRAAALVLPRVQPPSARLRGGSQAAAAPDDKPANAFLAPLGRAALRELARRAVHEEPPLDRDAMLVAWRDMELRRLVAIDTFEAQGRRYTIAIHPRTEESRVAELTARELEAATLAADGLANKLIAERMGVSLSTVGTLLSRAAAKLGVGSRAALVGARPHFARNRSS